MPKNTDKKKETKETKETKEKKKTTHIKKHKPEDKHISSYSNLSKLRKDKLIENTGNKYLKII
jgi:hypothetical protein